MALAAASQGPLEAVDRWRNSVTSKRYTRSDEEWGWSVAFLGFWGLDFSWPCGFLFLGLALVFLGFPVCLQVKVRKVNMFLKESRR